MKYSLVTVIRKYHGLVDGVWLQNHTGTLTTATEKARATERANSNRIAVAVVDDLNYTEPNYSFRTGLKRLDKAQSFELYAGYKADHSYVQISSLSWDEKTAKSSASNMPLAEHCDIYDRFFMRQVADVLQRPWNLENVDEMWVTTMPGSKEAAVTLVVDGKHPANYPLYGDDAKKILDLVNSWPLRSIDKDVSLNDAFSKQNATASIVNSAAKNLPSGWEWVDWNDGSGKLRSPEGKAYFSYDLTPYLNTGSIEYREDNNSSWSVFDGSLSAFKNFAESIISSRFLTKKEGLDQKIQSACTRAGESQTAHHIKAKKSEPEL